MVVQHWPFSRSILPGGVVPRPVMHRDISRRAGGSMSFRSGEIVLRSLTVFLRGRLKTPFDGLGSMALRPQALYWKPYRTIC
jgi:hypothetical protein